MEWIVARWITFVAILLATGACAVGVAVLPRTSVDSTTRQSIGREAARVGIGAALALIPASLLRLADQLLALRVEGQPMLEGFLPLLTATTWGVGFLWQFAATCLAVFGFWQASRAPEAATHWIVATIAAVGLCATPALQGHAIGSEEFTVLATASDILHVTGAGLWLGGVGVIGWLGVALPDADGIVLPAKAATADARLRVLVPLIPPVALPGAALLFASGVATSVLHLREPFDLWSAEWGRYVLVKFILFTFIVGLGAANWRCLGPRIKSASGVSELRRSLVIEVVIALLVLIVTALLVVTPLPGET